MMALMQTDQQTLFDDLFEGVDIEAIEGIHFDEALDRVAANELDRQASAAIVFNFERAQRQGDFIQIQEMAIVLGAMACMHDHLQEFSRQLTNSYVSDFTESLQASHDHDVHDHDEDDEEDGLNSRRKKKKAKKNLFSLFFASHVTR